MQAGRQTKHATAVASPESLMPSIDWGKRDVGRILGPLPTMGTKAAADASLRVLTTLRALGPFGPSVARGLDPQNLMHLRVCILRAKENQHSSSRNRDPCKDMQWFWCKQVVSDKRCSTLASFLLQHPTTNSDQDHTKPTNKTQRFSENTALTNFDAMTSQALLKSGRQCR